MYSGSREGAGRSGAGVTPMPSIAASLISAEGAAMTDGVKPSARTKMRASSRSCLPFC